MIVKIVKCSDHLRWYAQKVGNRYKVRKSIGGEYEVRTDDEMETINYIIPTDCVVDTEMSSNLYIIELNSFHAHHCEKINDARKQP